MHHGVKGKKLNRTGSHLKAMLKNMAVSLVLHEQIKTTLPKAKVIKPFVEKLITLGKRGNLHAKKRLFSIIQDGEAVNKICSELAERYKNRSGGYTRIMRAGFRYGDVAPVAVIELVDRNVSAKGSNNLKRSKEEVIETIETDEHKEKVEPKNVPKEQSKKIAKTKKDEAAFKSKGASAKVTTKLSGKGGGGRGK